MTDIQEELARFNREHPAPKARRFLTKEPRGKTTRTLDHGAFVFEPYDYLENPDLRITRAFVDAQNARTEAFLSRSDRLRQERQDVAQEEFRSVQTAMQFSVAYDERYAKREKTSIHESPQTQYGDRYFSTRTNLETNTIEYLMRDRPDSEPQVIIHQNKEGVPPPKAILPAPDGKKVAYLSVNATGLLCDLHIVTIGDDGTTSDRQYDSEVLPSGNGVFEWDQGGKGVLYHQLVMVNGDPALILKEAQADQEQGEIVINLAIDPEKGGSLKPVSAGTPDTPSGRYRFVEYMEHAQADKALIVLDRETGKDLLAFCAPQDAQIVPLAEVDGNILLFTDYEAPMGRVICVNPRKGEGRDLVPENPQNKLECAVVLKDRLVLGYRDVSAVRLAVHALDGDHLHDVPLPANSFATMSLSPDKNADLDINVQGFDHSPEEYRYRVEDNSLRLKTRARARLKDAVVERAYATSKDGTQVPMTIIRKKDVELDGTAAVQMHGYGGFNDLKLAHFRGDVQDWVDKGGIFVVTNLRGGGEFGQDWYDGGRHLNKQNVFDDFAACAEYLIDKQYTSPSRLAISGASNGGLLTLATALQRPELFGAVVSEVPVADMLFDRGHWYDDYGKPQEKQGDFASVMDYSPLHNIQDKKKYPPMLVVTGDKDEVVPPWQAYKFAATMQQKSPETLCLLQVQPGLGHNLGGPGSPDERMGTKNAHAFMELCIGPINQQQYKAALGERKPPSNTSWTGRVTQQAPVQDSTRTR